MQLRHEALKEVYRPSRSTTMKTLLTLLCSTVLVTVFSMGRPAMAQSPADTKSRSGGQWVSHQMNQPPPEVIEKNKLSSERLDEIRQLYLQAKKEQVDGSKAGAKTHK
jgi:hypothetical protein